MFGVLLLFFFLELLYCYFHVVLQFGVGLLQTRVFIKQFFILLCQLLIVFLRKRLGDVEVLIYVYV